MRCSSAGSSPPLRVKMMMLTAMGSDLIRLVTLRVGQVKHRHLLRTELIQLLAPSSYHGLLPNSDMRQCLAYLASRSSGRVACACGSVWWRSKQVEWSNHMHVLQLMRQRNWLSCRFTSSLFCFAMWVNCIWPQWNANKEAHFPKGQTLIY